MTFQAKRHAKMLDVSHLFHLGDVAVTFHAAYSSVNVDGVVEIGIIRSFVYAYPRNRRACIQPAVIVGVLASIQVAVFVGIFTVITGLNWFEGFGIGGN